MQLNVMLCLVNTLFAGNIGLCLATVWRGSPSYMKLEGSSLNKFNW